MTKRLSGLTAKNGLIKDDDAEHNYDNHAKSEHISDFGHRGVFSGARELKKLQSTDHQVGCCGCCCAPL